jgi:hypothetical protein
MKNIFLLSLIIALSSCNSSSEKTQALQNRIDSLESKLAQTYKPGLGEFMSSIQIHHAKLWFAGENQNWQLAGFEIGEIKEALEDIPVYCADRPEVQKLTMINPALDSLGDAINTKNLQQFKDGFILLTATCNSCHHATNHAFNVIKIPDAPPFSNQDFKVHTE